MSSEIERQIEGLIKGAPAPTALFVKAIDEQTKYVDALEEENYASAFAHLDIAEGLLKHLLTVSELNDEQRFDVHFGLIRGTSLRGVGERRRGQLEAARHAYGEGERMLEELKPKVFAVEKPGGWRKWLPGAKDKRNTEAVNTWHCTKGGLLMNRGALESDCGETQRALETWQQAEQHLFDNYVKQNGPEADLEATAKVFNLWENILVSALKTNNGALAGRMVTYCIKLYSYWLAQGLEVPEEINMAFASTISQIQDLEPKSRSLLDANIPKELQEILSSFEESD